MTEFSPQQDDALQAVEAWLKAKPGSNGTPQIFRLFGYAGTGKTTLARHIADGVDGEVKFAAFTGKAARGDARQRLPRRLHHPLADLPHARERRGSAELRPVGRGAGLEGRSHHHRRVLDGRRRAWPRPVVVRRAGAGARRSGAIAADPGRRGFFTEHEPDVMLTEVHRQAQDNPIVRLSMDIRAGEYLEPGRYGETRGGRAKAISIRNACSRPTRCWSAATIRGAATTRGCASGAASPATMPEAGDKLVCLRNNRKKGLFNGSLWSVKERGGTEDRHHDDAAVARGRDRDARRQGLGAAGMLRRRHRAIDWQRSKPYDEFDYGYVLTVHKAQGSQWDDVVLFDESFAFQETRERWLYTGITRAAKRLTVVV